ncbi:MAG: GNAT family N-acetyltransferase [Bacteroidota bacterium]
MKLPPYNTFPAIVSDKIILRQVLESDLKDILEIQYYDGKAAATEAEAKTMLDKIDQNYIDGDSIHWGIADKITNQLVGTLGYYRGFEKRTGELGCVLLPAFRGKGYMIMAMELAVDFGIKEIQLQRIVAITTTENEAAIKLLGRLGFIKTINLEDNSIEFEYRGK